MNCNTTIVRGVSASEPSFWETDIEVVKSCGVLAEPIRISVSPLFRAKVNFLMNKFERMEWLAYLIGNKETMEVTDIVIPDQRVTPVNVYVDGTVDVPIIGVIHSHHDMGNGFSGTDDAFINQNHDISLCVNKTSIKGHARVKTECNRYALVPVNVVESVEGFDISDFGTEVDARITEKKIITRKVMTKDGVVEWDDSEISIEDMTEIAKGFRRTSTNIGLEIANYRDSLKSIPLDESHKAEMLNIINFIDSIDTEEFEFVEEQVCAPDNNFIFSEDYFDLVDEISSSCESMTERERVSLNRLAVELNKMLSVNTFAGDDSISITNVGMI